MSKPRNVGAALGLITTISSAFKFKFRNAETEDLVLEIPEYQQVLLAQDMAEYYRLAGEYFAILSKRRSLEVRGVLPHDTMDASILNGMVVELNPEALEIPNGPRFGERREFQLMPAKHFGATSSFARKDIKEGMTEFDLRPALGWELVWFWSAFKEYRPFAEKSTGIDVVSAGEKSCCYLRIDRKQIVLREYSHAGLQSTVPADEMIYYLGVGNY